MILFHMVFFNHWPNVGFDWGVGELRWAKSRDGYRRIARESYRCDSNRWRSSPPKTQRLVLGDPAFVVLRFGSCDPIHVELQNGLIARVDSVR